MAPKKTTREQIEEMTAKGLTPRQIANLLGITTQGVYWHLARIKAEVPDDVDSPKAAIG